MKISVIIPALNEAAEIGGAIGGAIESAAGEGGGETVEVIVSDGGSNDGTLEAAKGMGARVVEGPPGRGLQMDRASRVASGEVLLFLHADTRLPRGWHEAVRGCLEDKNVVGGAFTLAIDSPKKWFRMVEWVVRARTNLFGLMYGDQAIFARREVYEKLGGYRGLPLMEDVDFIRRLAGEGNVVCLGQHVVASVRRWAERGALSAGVKNWFFLALYFTGVSPKRLYKWYYGKDVS